MTLTDQNLMNVLGAATVVSFVLLLIASDAGASQTTILSAVSAVAVLGAMTFTVIMGARRSL